MAHTIKISGVSDELLARVDARWRDRHYADRSEYVRDLIRRDLLGESAPTLSQRVRSLFRALHEETAKGELTEDEIADDVAAALREVRDRKRLANLGAGRA